MSLHFRHWDFFETWCHETWDMRCHASCHETWCHDTCDIETSLRLPVIRRETWDFMSRVMGLDVMTPQTLRFLWDLLSWDFRHEPSCLRCVRHIARTVTAVPLCPCERITSNMLKCHVTHVNKSRHMRHVIQKRHVTQNWVKKGMAATFLTMRRLIHSHQHTAESQLCFDHLLKLQAFLATHCNALHHTATHCNVRLCVAVCCCALQCVVEYCSDLQCAAVRCSALQCAAVCYSVL